MFAAEDNASCDEAERLIKAFCSTEDKEAGGELRRKAGELLLPLVKRGMPHARYLYACYLLAKEITDKAAYEQRYFSLIESAAHQGHAKAQFRLGQAYDEGGELGHNAAVSAHWFKLSAEQGYAYAQWVHGLNLLHGVGTAKDEDQGLVYIRRAAEGKFEGAIQFISDAYSEGRFGFPKDKLHSEEWRKKLQDPDVVGY
jgi:uncharacterized protein